jgi:hypothetical protein
MKYILQGISAVYSISDQSSMKPLQEPTLQRRVLEESFGSSVPHILRLGPIINDPWC